MAYLEGRDGAQDLDKGVTLLKHAADGEVSALAAHKLETGEGRVPKDTDRAKKLYQYACKEHHLQDACAAASRL
jgi:TPR repeat protein